MNDYTDMYVMIVTISMLTLMPTLIIVLARA